jgi:hypothetical protein
VRALRAAARIGAAAAAVAIAATVGLSGAARDAGGSPPPARHPSVPGVALIAGKALQSARCAQWRVGTRAERAGVVATLANVVGGPTPYGRASTLPAPVAHRLFDRACARPYARGFLLYELYTRAAAFYGTPRDAL